MGCIADYLITPFREKWSFSRHAALCSRTSPKPLCAVAHLNARVCVLKQGPHSPLHGFLTNQPTNPGKPRLLAARLGAEGCPYISRTSNSPVSPLSLFLPPSPFVAPEEGLGHPGAFLLPRWLLRGRMEVAPAGTGWAPCPCVPLPLWQHFSIAPIPATEYFPES